MTSLIISLPPGGVDATSALDYVLVTEANSISAHGCVALSLLPAANEQVALVCAARLSWHQVQLPAGSLPRALAGERGSQRLRAILDGLLEDQLLDDPALLHFALQPQPGTGAPIWLAACDRAWLQGALTALAQAGREVTRIVPEFTPQQLNARIYVIGDANAAQVAGRLHAPAGDAGLLVSSLTATSVALLEGATEVGAQVPAELIAEPAVAALAEQFFARPVRIEQRPERWLQAAQSSWNLAQFELAHAARTRRMAHAYLLLASFARAQQWRAARWALASTVLIHLVGLNAWAWHERAALQTQRQQIRALLASTFPQVKVVLDPALQMAREVQSLQRASHTLDGADLERVLAHVAAAVPADYLANTLDYQASELRLGGSALSAKDRDSLPAKLKAAGLSARMQGDDWLIGGRP